MKARLLALGFFALPGLLACGRAGFSNWPDVQRGSTAGLDAGAYFDSGKLTEAGSADHDDASLADLDDASPPNPVAIAIEDPVASSVINAATHLHFWLSGRCDPAGSRIAINAAQLQAQQTSACPQDGQFSTSLVFADSPGCVTTVFVSQSDVEGTLNSDFREFYLDTQALAASDLNWQQGDFASTTAMHARWQVSADPSLLSQAIELHQGDSACGDANVQVIDINDSFTNSWDFKGDNSQRYSFRIRSTDQAGNVALSACSPVLTVHPYSWRNIGADYWPEVQQRLQEAAAQGSSAEPTVRQISYTVLTTEIAPFYQGSILAPNGKIYGVPRLAMQMAELQAFDTDDPLITLVGPDIGGDDKWYSGALAFNGQIYTSASDYNFALHIDPDLPQNSGAIDNTDLGNALNKWVSLILVPNGKLYGCPRDDAFVLEIDPNGVSGATVHRVGPDLGDSADKWWNGALAPDGKIYCFPYSATRILQIDPQNLSSTGIKRVGPDFGSHLSKWCGGSIALNGHIFAPPCSDPQVLEIVPEDIDSSRRVGPDWGTDNDKWHAAVLAGNGHIYAIPGRDSRVLEIDPQALDDTGIRRVGASLPAGNANKYYGGTLAPNGKIYAFPWVEGNLLEIDPHANASLDMDSLLSPYLNGN